MIHRHNQKLPSVIKEARPKMREGMTVRAPDAVVPPAARVAKVPNLTVDENLYGVASDSPTAPIWIETT